MYTLIDAIRDEVSLQQDYCNGLNEMIEHDPGLETSVHVHQYQRTHATVGIALRRIADRLEKGIEYQIDHDDKSKYPRSKSINTNRHLEDKYEDLAAAKAEYERILAGCQVIDKLSK